MTLGRAVYVTQRSSLGGTGGGSALHEKCVDERLNLPVQDLVDTGGLQPRSMILDELVRGENVGADLAPPGDLLLVAFELGHLLLLLPTIVVVQPRTQDLHRCGLIFMLRPLIQ